MDPPRWGHRALLSGFLRMVFLERLRRLLRDYLLFPRVEVFERSARRWLLSLSSWLVG